ncbi:hypothetical protein D3C72_2196610 [compost metagenome]
MQLRFGIGIFAFGKQVRPLRQALQGQRWAADGLAHCLGQDAGHVRIAKAQMPERTGNRGGAEPPQAFDQML